MSASLAPRYRLEPLCLTASVAELRAWLADAAAGDAFIYARGPVLDRAREVVTFAAEQERAGAVRLHQVRPSEGKGFDYIAVKRGAGEAGASEAGATGSLSAAAIASDRLARRAADRAEQLDAVFALLNRHAEAGMSCPTNGEIARWLSLGEAHHARYLVDQLEEAGRIKIQNRGPRTTRIVTIVATRAETCRSARAVGRGLLLETGRAGR